MRRKRGLSSFLKELNKRWVTYQGIIGYVVTAGQEDVSEIAFGLLDLSLACLSVLSVRSVVKSFFLSVVSAHFGPIRGQNPLMSKPVPKKFT